MDLNTHKKNGNYVWDGGNINTRVEITSQFINGPNQHTVHIKLNTMLYVNCISMELEEEQKQNNEKKEK